MTAENAALPSGYHLYFDCFSGVAGDMVLGALIDLGVPLGVIEAAVGALPLTGYRIRVEKEKRHQVVATRFFVDVEESHQPHRHFSDIRKMIEDAPLDPGVAAMAIDIFACIATAEAQIHGSTVDKVHFHEVGAVDSIVDIVGAAAALAHLDATVSSSVIPLGRGTMQTQHGVLPIPAPATLLILKGVPVEGTEISAELTTPTGAAILKTAATEFGRFPAMMPEKIGFGAGSRSHKTRPGLLRVVLGQRSDIDQTQMQPTCYVIEANVDDMTGEVAAQAARQLLQAGALDAWLEPIQMKKGRPALKVGVLCRRENLDQMAQTLFSETPTIGLRYYGVHRLEMNREMHVVKTPFGDIRVKVARRPDGAVNAAPEFEDCLKAATVHDVAVKRVIAVAAGLAQTLLD